MPNLLLYGANGYTGALVARTMVAHGIRPVLAGRNADAVAALARELSLEHRTFALDEPSKVDEGLHGMDAVLLCAGPFARTSKPMADACLRNRCHYLDLTGEAEVFEALATRDAEAKAAGVMLLPGVGFDVVPSDCLAAHLKRRLPSATRLTLAIFSQGRLSRGTATTIVENIDRGGLVRKGGVLMRVPAAWKTRSFDFGSGPVKAIAIPWGDVVTAYFSTNIPDIEVYLAAPWGRRLAARMSRYLGWLLGSSFVKGFLKRRIHSGPPGPSDEERASGRTVLWGEASDDAGQRVEARLTGPEGYTFTARAALAVVKRVLAGESRPGFQTPSTVLGPDMVLTLDGVAREDVT